MLGHCTFPPLPALEVLSIQNLVPQIACFHSTHSVAESLEEPDEPVFPLLEAETSEQGKPEDFFSYFTNSIMNAFPPLLAHAPTNPRLFTWTRSLLGPPASAVSAPVPRRHLSTLPKPPEHPVVLCHGLFGFDMLGFRQLPLLQMNYWGTIPDTLEELGIKVFVAKVPPSADVSVRATALYEQLVKFFPAGTKLNLVGHSMGGLDCRYMTSVILPNLPEEKRSISVKSITTLVTPHRGSPFAEWVIKKLGIDDRFEKNLQMVGLDIAALSCLTPSYCQNVFNPKVQDQPGVYYFSFGAAASREMVNRTPLEFSFKVIEEVEGPNDGLVSVESSVWGEYQETLLGDHLDLIGVKPAFMIRYPTQVNLAQKTFENIVKTLVDRGC